MKCQLVTKCIECTGVEAKVGVADGCNVVEILVEYESMEASSRTNSSFQLNGTRWCPKVDVQDQI